MITFVASNDAMQVTTSITRKYLDTNPLKGKGGRDRDDWGEKKRYLTEQCSWLSKAFSSFEMIPINACKHSPASYMYYKEKVKKLTCCSKSPSPLR